MRERSNILSTIQRHIRRVLDTDWSKCIPDFRYRRSTAWNLGYVLEILMAGALSGCKTLRDIETLSEIYGQRVPDTTLHDIMVKLNPEGLRAELSKGVKRALRDHELAVDEFPIRITAIDGKGNYNTRQVVNKSSEPIGGGGNNEQYRHMALRAMHVSSEVKLFLGQLEIESKGSETRELIEFVDQLQKHYGRTGLLDVISVDAGMISRKNAKELVDRKLNYIMAVKGSQKKLFALAQSTLAELAPHCITEEIYNGNQVTRKITRAASPGIEHWEHVTELWRIETITTDRDGATLSNDTRYYVTSIPATTLTHKQVLEAIRMHWGIENNANWCFDMLWNEDTAPWTSGAMVLVAHLRMMAYNIIQRLKVRKLKAMNYRTIAWRDLFRFFEHALCQLRSAAEIYGEAVPAFL